MKRFRKHLALLVAMLLCLGGVFVPASADSDIVWVNAMRVMESGQAVGEQGAIAVAVSTLWGCAGMLQSDFDKYTIQATDKGDGDTWRVSMDHPEYPELSCDITVSLAQMQPLSVDPDDYMERYSEHYGALQKTIEGYATEWEERLGLPVNLWPYEERGEFAKEYGRNPDFYGAQLYGLPRENDVSYEAALAIAKEVCVEQMGAEAEVVDQMPVDCCYYLDMPLDGLAIIGNVWWFTFLEPEPNEEGFYFPRYQVRIDPQNGDVISFDNNDGTGNG